VVVVPGLLTTGALEDGMTVAGSYVRLDTFESNVLYALRFMIDTKMGGGSWVEVAQGKWKPVQEGTGASYCQIEAHCKWNDLVAHPAEGKMLCLTSSCPEQCQSLF
jgi:DNA polymerase delta subunit 1